MAARSTCLLHSRLALARGLRLLALGLFALRLLALGLLGARLGSAFGLALDAAAQRIHQVDDIGLAMRRLRLDRQALLLGADQLDQSILVAVLELLGLELAR